MNIHFIYLFSASFFFKHFTLSFWCRFYYTLNDFRKKVFDVYIKKKQKKMREKATRKQKFLDAKEEINRDNERN